MTAKETNKTKQTNQMPANPRQFIYPQGTKIEIEGYLLSDLIMIMENLVKDEVKGESKFKYNFVNEKGAVVKSPKATDIETGKVRKILDFNRTIVEPNIEYSITEKGVAYAELKNFLESLHMENIQKGVAVDYAEMAANAAVEQKNTEIKD